MNVPNALVVVVGETGAVVELAAMVLEIEAVVDVDEGGGINGWAS